MNGAKTFLDPLAPLQESLVSSTAAFHSSLAVDDIDNGTDLAPLPSSLEAFETFIDDSIQSIRASYRPQLKATSFQRKLVEKYGFLTPIVTHPTMKQVRGNGGSS